MATLLVVSATGCQPPRTSDRGTFRSTILTPEGDDDYRYAVEPGGAIHVRPLSTNTSTNLRVAGVAEDAPVTTDHLACVTWRGQDRGYVQPGIVLRLRTDAGRVRAIIVTNNVVYGYRQAFNVHLVDSTTTSTLTQVGSVRATWATTPPPWRICARAVGARVDLKAWPATQPEPAWDDPAFAGSVAVPSSWVFPGQPGWFAGHLAVGERLTYTNATTSAITPAA